MLHPTSSDEILANDVVILGSAETVANAILRLASQLDLMDEDARPSARAEVGVKLPVFARHVHRARARDKSAVYAVAQRRCGKLKRRATG